MQIASYAIYHILLTLLDKYYSCDYTSGIFYYFIPIYSCESNNPSLALSKLSDRNLKKQPIKLPI